MLLIIKKLNIALIALLFLLSGCAEKEEKFDEMSVETLYDQAAKEYESKKFKRAAKLFAEVEKQHPYSNWALRAQLMSAYCYYESQDYENAEEGFQTFIQLHPAHKDVEYATYMIALCNYEQIPIVERDQKSTKGALNSFEELIKKFPSSIYARDARFKIDLIKDHLAGKEMETGRWYLTVDKQPLAALNRFKNVIKDYEHTSHVPEALYRMVECYISIGISEQAKQTTAVLGYNYPKSIWYKKAYDLLSAPKS
jgi:outer membrane protein assembly factor BamD